MPPEITYARLCQMACVERRRNKGGNTQLRLNGAIQQTGREAESQHDKICPGADAAQQDGQHHGAAGSHGAGGKVDGAQHQHERLSCRHDHYGRHILQQIQDVARAEECRINEAKYDRKYDNGQERQAFGHELPIVQHAVFQIHLALHVFHLTSCTARCQPVPVWHQPARRIPW